MVQLGEYLCKRLSEAGAKTLFGVPGDFALGLLNCVVKSKLDYVGTCNELNAAYAADGYARIHGLGLCCVTYAVGELSAINGVAGSYAESVPVVVLVGAPARKNFLEMPLLHHTLGDYMIPLKMFTMITCAQELLTNPQTAARQIDNALTMVLTKKRPVYIAVPSDMVFEEILGLPSPFQIVSEFPPSDPDSLSEAIEEVSSRLNKAKNPILIPGVELIRRNLSKEFEKFVKKTKIPYVTMMLSKAILDEDNDYFIGLYSGRRSREEVMAAMDESDCILIIGEKMTDFNTGGFTAKFEKKHRIQVSYDSVVVSSHVYQQVYINDFLKELTSVSTEHVRSRQLKAARDSCTHRVNSPMGIPTDENLTMSYFFEVMAHYIKPNSVVIAETGASLFSAAETMMPSGCTFIGQTFYGSIGYTMGSCLGACMAIKDKDRDCYLFIGDGSFQVTCQDLSTMIRYKTNPVIFLINNDGYTIERVITDNIYNDVQPWKYSDIPKAFGGKQGIVVRTQSELQSALKYTTDNPKELHFVEVMLDQWDCNELLKSAGRSMAMSNGLLSN